MRPVSPPTNVTSKRASCSNLPRPHLCSLIQAADPFNPRLIYLFPPGTFPILARLNNTNNQLCEVAMNKKIFAVLAAALTFIVGVAIAKLTLPGLRNTPAATKKTEIQLSNYRLSGPYEYENLTIFLVHGPDQSFSGPFTPLQEAM